jgi:RNA polymerase subunit RPABC4/transcription elongation factor Spt4
MIYFCQGCSAVLEHRVKYCPHCGREQIYDDTCGHCGADVKEEDKYCPECGDYIERDEDKTRYCPNCSNNLDTDGRHLDLKYCFGDDCGIEIGGLIRYSEQTGEPLPIDEILTQNNYEKEIADWFTSIHNNANDGYLHCFDRMLYIYDKAELYKINQVVDDFSKVLDDIYIYPLEEFSSLWDDSVLMALADNEKHPPLNNQFCLCATYIPACEEETEAHEIIEECKGKYRPKIEGHYYQRKYELNVSFVFVSNVLPEVSKIGTIYDKHILTVTPEILKSLDISKLWKGLKEE